MIGDKFKEQRGNTPNEKWSLRQVRDKKLRPRETVPSTYKGGVFGQGEGGARALLTRKEGPIGKTSKGKPFELV